MVSVVSSPVNSTEELRKSNRHSVYSEIFKNAPIAKQDIAGNLGLSLPTVTQNLAELQEMGLVCKNGVFDSTGGRKPTAYAVVADARVAIGIFVQKASFRIVAVSLFGNVLHSDVFDTPFAEDDGYYATLGTSLEGFVKRHRLKRDAILGVNFALEAIVSPDHTSVTYSEVYRCRGLTAEVLSRYIPYPIKLYHDGHATAEAELWAQKDMKNGLMIILNRYLGGALIIDGKICEGKDFGCTLEHMALSPEGPKCYCGKHGCFESFCSAYALERDSGEPVNEFFARLRTGDKARTAIWDRFLSYLATAIGNIRMIIDCEFIIGGLLLSYMTEEDFVKLRALTDAKCPFSLGAVDIAPSKNESESAAQGAALPLVEEFLLDI